MSVVSINIVTTAVRAAAGLWRSVIGIQVEGMIIPFAKRGSILSPTRAGAEKIAEHDARKTLVELHKLEVIDPGAVKVELRKYNYKYDRSLVDQPGVELNFN